jgi:ABC-type phosphate transport system substrate-binding protein
MTVRFEHIAVIAAIFLAGLSAASAADLVVVVNPRNPIARLSADDAGAYFLGQSLGLRPIDQADGSPIRDEFYRKVVGKEPARVKAIWSKMVFTGKGVPPRQFSSSAEVKRAVAADPAAIAYIEQSAVDTSVKVVLSFD